jgi:hypothetical protein
MYLALVELSGFSAQMKSVILLVMVICGVWKMNISVNLRGYTEKKVLICAQRYGLREEMGEFCMNRLTGMRDPWVGYVCVSQFGALPYDKKSL